MPRATAITFPASALADLEDILTYYTDQSVPEVGRSLVAKIITDIELLATQPDLGRIVPEFEQDFLRELIRPPFRIVYRRGKAAIRIVRVWRAERLLILP